MRVPQTKGTKGSLKWIQELINNQSAVFDKQTFKNLNISPKPITWLSPLKSDQYSEYRDGSFLDLLGLIKFKSQLRNFWPRNGPQWDALGRVSEGGPYFLVEAKANIPEIMSSLGAKSEKSIALIRKSPSETRRFLKCKDSDLWEKGFYQYANRIAHLYFLRQICKVDAYLIFLYFLNDHTHIPTTQDEWYGALELQKSLLGLKNHRLKKYIADVFTDVKSYHNFPNINL